MTKTSTTASIRFAALVVALLMIASALGPIGTVTAQTVSITQTAQGDTTVAPGETVTVEATIDYTDANSPAIDVTLPPGWTVVNHTDDGGTYGPPQPAWAWLEGDEDGVNGSHTVTYTVQVPSNESAGTYTISAEGQIIDPSDSSFVSDTDDLTVTVEETEIDNQPPTADAGADQTVDEGATVTLDATGSSDEDGTIISYAWSQESGPTVDLSDTSEAMPTFTAPDVSSETTFTFAVEVTDDDGATANDTVSITVQPIAEPADPSVSIEQSATSPTTVVPGDAISLEATIDYANVNSPAIDVTLPPDWTVVNHTDDGGTYGPPQPAWAWLEGDADGVNGSHTVTYTVQVPSNESVGDYTISATGSGVDPTDGSIVNDTDDVTVTVEETEPDNQPPEASFSFSPDDPETSEEVTFDAAASSDPDGTIESYAWDFGDGETATGEQATHTYDDAGMYTVSLTVTDDDGATATDTQSVEVSEAPVAGSGSTEVLVTPNSGIEASTYGSGSFQVENVGDQPIEAISFDLSTSALPDMVFDPNGTAGDQAGKGFTADSGASTVGLVSGAFSQPHNDAGGDDGYDVLTVTFDDFDPGESFAFSADNDPTSIKNATVSSQEAGSISGLELARSTVAVEYADGTTQTSQLMGDGSDGGAATTLGSSTPDAPSIGVDGVTLDDSTLDEYHSSALVNEAAQTVTVSGAPNDDVILLRIEAELELDDVPEYDGTPGYDIEAFEANHAEDVQYDTVNLGDDGEVEVPVTLTRSTEPNLEGEASGLNYFVAVVENDVGLAGPGSNVVVLEYDPDAVTNLPPSASFSFSPDDPGTGEEVTFDATDSADPDGTIESFDWTIETVDGVSSTTLLESDFEGGSLSTAGWTHDAIEDASSAGVSDATSNSGTLSAYHNGGEGAIVSEPVDTSAAQSVMLQYWVQKGADTFSENPDANAGEDLVVEYLDAGGDWVEVDRIEDTVEPGAEVTGDVTLTDGAALHDGFQLRFRQQGASIAGGDFWHVDDVSIVAQSGGNGGTVTGSGETITHSFGAAGEYDVTLTVTDDDGQTDSTTQTIVVTEPVEVPMSVAEAIASLNPDGDDSLIDTEELQAAIDLWIEDDPVPGTDGETISTEDLQELIDLWVEDDPIDGATGGDS